MTDKVRFARYSTFASYLRGDRAAYTTKTHVIGAYGPPSSGHRVATTLCNKRFSDLEVHDGNGVAEPYADQQVTCKVCAKKLRAASAAASST